ncbi:MAG: hypothetical protein PHO48_03525, partial [Candidatus Gracilibacteria bacterium]|nr:hypothetical protein [Candidatus Gracilibacteria bacterium]
AFYIALGVVFTISISSAFAAWNSTKASGDLILASDWNDLVTYLGTFGTAATKNVGTAANDVIQLDANAKIPAVDGSQLTGINDLSIFSTLLASISAARTSGAIPSGYEWLFATDELATKTNATYFDTSKLYSNDGSFGTDVTSTSYTIYGGATGWTLTPSNSFDNNGSTNGGINSGYLALGSTYIGQNFGAGNGKNIRRINITMPTQDYMTNGTVMYSDDGSAYSSAGTFATSAGSNTLDFISYGAHQYWKIVVNSAAGAGGLGIGTGSAAFSEIEMIERSASTNITLIPTAITAGAAPTYADFYLLHKAVDSVTLNTDIKVRASRDNGSSWSAYITLAEVCQFDSNYKILKGTANLSALASGTSVKWEITTYNAKSQQIRSVATIFR